jgi:Xaa-Pro aminopeptidase
VKEIANEMIDSCGHMKKSAEVREFYLKLNRKYKLPAPVHSLGHGIGLDVHEYPRFGKKYDDEIVKTAFTVEPAAYFGSFGVRYEETLFHNGKRIVVL